MHSAEAIDRTGSESASEGRRLLLDTTTDRKPRPAGAEVWLQWGSRLLVLAVAAALIAIPASAEEADLHRSLRIMAGSSLVLLLSLRELLARPARS